MNLSWKNLACTLALAAATSGVGAEAKDTPTQASCRQYVGAFYDWYIKPGKNGSEMTTDQMLKVRSKDFDGELKKRLKEDADASAKVEGEIVGLDFDPILATNAEPYKKYVVGNVTKKGNVYLADVFGIDGGKKTAKPVITPELRQIGNTWQFVNFHYGKSEFPENENLLSVLKALRESRAKDPK